MAFTLSASSDEYETSIGLRLMVHKSTGFIFLVTATLSTGCAVLNDFYTDVDELPGNRIKITNKGSFTSESEAEIIEKRAEKECNGGYTLISTDVNSYDGNLEAIVQCDGSRKTKAEPNKKPPIDKLVKNAQAKLNELGYPAGPADGIMGKGTAQALREFQTDNGLEVTGNLDTPTKDLLGI